MSKQANIELQTKFGDAIASGNMDKMYDLVSEDCVDHDPAPGQAAGPEGYIKFFKMMQTAFRI